MYFKGRGYKEGSRPGEASEQLRSAPGPPDQQIKEKMQKSSRKQRTMELVRISPPPPAAPGQLPEYPGTPSRQVRKGSRTASRNCLKPAHRQFQNDSQRAAGRLPESSGKTFGQLSGSPVFLYFIIPFPFCLIFSITVGARISPKSSGLAR